MNRGPSGRIVTFPIGGEEVRAFVPLGLPPEPPLEMNGQRQTLMEQALIALGRLDALSHLLPDARLFLYASSETRQSFRPKLREPGPLCRTSSSSRWMKHQGCRWRMYWTSPTM